MTRTVFFDLDGTLLDTAPDLAFALNQVRHEQGLERLPFEQVRPVVSHGSVGLLQLGFGLGPNDGPRFDRLRQRLLDIYQAHLAVHTKLFPGMDQVLQTLEQRNIPWGVVTNKPGWLTEPLLTQLELKQRAACIVSGDSTVKRKPDPEPMLHACNLAGCGADDCVYVGDAERDIAAGRNAGMKTLVALFGYIGADEHPESWGADGLLHAPADLLRWLDEEAPGRPD